jgi:hypothetical protein
MTSWAPLGAAGHGAIERIAAIRCGFVGAGLRDDILDIRLGPVADVPRWTTPDGTVRGTGRSADGCGHTQRAIGGLKSDSRKWSSSQRPQCGEVAHSLRHERTRYAVLTAADEYGSVSPGGTFGRRRERFPQRTPHSRYPRPRGSGECPPVLSTVPGRPVRRDHAASA